MDNIQTANIIKNTCKRRLVAINTMLAECGIRKSLIYDMEKRSKTPSAEILEKIADYLNVSVDYLLGRTDYPYTVQAGENGKPVITPDGEPPICTDD